MGYPDQCGRRARFMACWLTLAATTAVHAGDAKSAAANGAAISRAAWSFDRSSLLFNDHVDPAKEKSAGRISASGWIEYDFNIEKPGWFELWFDGMSLDWVRDISIDGTMRYRQSIATEADRDGESAKECNLYLTSGKHTLRIQRLAGPGQLPSHWSLVAAGGRPEASVAIESIADQIIAPGGSFSVNLIGGGAEKAIKLDLQLKSLIDDSLHPAGSVEFPVGPEPTRQQVTIANPPPGSYLLIATCEGKPLRPNDLKAMPLVVLPTGKEMFPAHAPHSLHVAGVYSSGMVVQRDVKLPVWGWAAPGTSVTIEFAGQKQESTADAGGRWSATFAPLAVGGPYEMKVAAGKEKVAFDDILAGDVWLLGGQSNMGGRLRETTDGKTVAASDANYPNVRLGWVADHGAIGEGDHLEPTVAAAWQPAALGPKQTLDQLLAWNSIAFRFGTDLHRELNIPIGMLINNRGGTLITAWTSLATQRREPAFAQSINKWETDSRDNGYHAAAASSVFGMIRTAKNSAKGGPINIDDALRSRLELLTRNEPSRQYETLTKPITPFPIKGVVWYQGESDSLVAYQYGSMLKAFIGDWRTTFGDEKLPFVVVQIAPGTGKPTTADPAESRFGELQQAQASILSTPNTSIATTYDLTTPTDDVHYRNKLPVGHRAALAALHDVYGKSDIVASGPVYESMKIDGGSIRVKFSGLANGLKCGGEKLGGFSIAGSDQKFVWADAKIDGDSVIVSSPAVRAPVAVRYGWDNSPCGANLVNTADLPARVFRTDDWVWTTQVRTEALYGKSTSN